MTIRTLYAGQPPKFPATDQHPNAVRFGPIVVAGAEYFADAIGGAPTADDVAAFLQSAIPRRLIRKSLIIDRLNAAGLLAAARTALDGADVYTRERWNVRTEIYADDPTAIAMLSAIGGDPDAILAPE